MAYEYKESHKHKLAKELLFKWLNDEEKGKNGITHRTHNGNPTPWCCIFAQFAWHPFGVFMELVVQEKDQEYYFDGFDRVANDFIIDEYCGYPKQELKANYNKIVPELGKILFVPDIVVFHKGHPAYIFEITHTHPLTPEKVQSMKDFFSGVQVIEIMADDILNLDCTKIPEKIKCMEW